MVATRIFFLKKFNSAQVKDSAYDSELLAAYASVRHFRHRLEGRQFILFTDHRPLTFAFVQKNESASPRRVRYLDFIGQFSTNIQHISGKENVVADALSRINEVRSELGSVDFPQIARA